MLLNSALDPRPTYNLLYAVFVFRPEVFDLMSNVISLREVIAALEAATDECRSYLDPKTGEIITITEEERALAEEKSWEDAPAWQREMMPKVRAALESDQFLELPDRFDIHEWSIMEHSRGNRRSSEFGASY